MSDPATAAALERQLEMVDAEIWGIEEFLRLAPDAKDRAYWETRLRRFKQSRSHFEQRYLKKTGIQRVPRVRIVVNQKEFLDQQRAKKQADHQRQTKKDIQRQIDTIRNGLRMFRSAVQREYQHAHAWGLNFIISDLSRIGGGVWWRTPLILRNRTVPQVEAGLNQASAALAQGNLERAKQRLALARRWLQWGLSRFNTYLDRVQAGGERVVTGIKLTATVATAIVTGGASTAGLAVGVTEGAMLGVVGEGSQQAVTLIAKGIDGGHTVSGEDVFNAVMETAVAGTAGSIGEGGKLVVQAVAGKIAARIATRILGRAPTATEIAFVTDRIKSVVSANYSQFVKKATKIDKNPNWDAWAGLVAPMLKGMTATVIQNGGMREPFVDAIDQRVNDAKRAKKGVAGSARR